MNKYIYIHTYIYTPLLGKTRPETPAKFRWFHGRVFDGETTDWSPLAGSWGSPRHAESDLPSAPLWEFLPWENPSEMVTYSMKYQWRWWWLMMIPIFNHYSDWKWWVYRKKKQQNPIFTWGKSIETSSIGILWVYDRIISEPPNNF